MEKRAEATIAGVLHLEGREGPENAILRAKLTFDDGEITVVARKPTVVYQLSGIAPESVVRIVGRLVQHRWTIGNGRRLTEIQLQPEAVTVIEDARKREMLGGKRA
jgi:hypothetical protein